MHLVLNPKNAPILSSQTALLLRARFYRVIKPNNLLRRVLFPSPLPQLLAQVEVRPACGARSGTSRNRTDRTLLLLLFLGREKACGLMVGVLGIVVGENSQIKELCL